MLYDFSPEPATTPFIPPLPSPESVAPPIIPPPPPNHNPPAWAQQARTPGQYPYYPATPYNTTPFIPGTVPSAHSTPAMQPPGSYFAPPSNLPHVYGGPAAQGHGFSSDYTGYPNANPNATPNGNPSPFVPPNQPPPGTPWAAPGTGFSAFQQPLPPGPPPGWGPQVGGFTPAGYPMAPPYATPAAAAWGMPMHPAYGYPGVPPGPPGGYAGHTPWMHPTAPPPAPPQPPDTADAHFRWTSSADHIDPFAEGPHCMPFVSVPFGIL